jgi:outer membrane murein-binding lipoprotein Lpp
MQITRTMALSFGSLVLAAPLLAGCAEDYATTYIYTPAAGVNDRSGTVDVLNAAIVSTDGDTGTFIASLANQSTEEDAALEGITGVNPDNGSPLEFTLPGPVELLPQGLVNLAYGVEGVDAGPGTTEAQLAEASRIEVSGDFGLGDFVDVELSFADGTTLELSIPVVPNNDEFAGIDGDELTPTEEHAGAEH